MHPPPPGTALRGPIWGSTEGFNGGARMRALTQCSVSWTLGELHRRPPKKIFTIAVFTIAYGWALRRYN
eukprot:1110805-Pyramimonas_sp.AAC.1